MLAKGTSSATSASKHRGGIHPELHREELPRLGITSLGRRIHQGRGLFPLCSLVLRFHHGMDSLHITSCIDSKIIFWISIAICVGVHSRTVPPSTLHLHLLHPNILVLVLDLVLDLYTRC